jgi:hypothetical protein
VTSWAGSMPYPTLFVFERLILEIERLQSASLHVQTRSGVFSFASERAPWHEMCMLARDALFRAATAGAS